MRMRPQVISLPMEALPVNQPVQASPSNLPSEMHEINLYEGQWNSWSYFQTIGRARILPLCTFHGSAQVWTSTGCGLPRL